MNFYENNYYLRTSDFNMENNIHPSAVLDLFQDAAGKHANLLGVGMDELEKKNLTWVVMRTKFQILKNPMIHSMVRLKTWPEKPQRAIFQRNYEIYSHDELIIKGTSEWVLLDKTTNKMVPAQGVYPEMEFLTKKTFTEKLTKFADFEQEDIFGKTIAEYSDIDANGHVNNAKYANYVMNVLKNPQIIDIFQIHYHREVKCGEELGIYIKNTQEGYVAKALKNGEAMFSCKILFKEQL